MRLGGHQGVRVEEGRETCCRAWAPAFLGGGGGLDVRCGWGSGVKAVNRDTEGERGQVQGDLQEILLGSSKSAPEAHYYCPQGAERGEGGQILLAEK